MFRKTISFQINGEKKLNTLEGSKGTKITKKLKFW